MHRRIAIVELDQDNRVGARPRYLPVVVVPGFLGTRLADPTTGSLVWNPLGGPHGDDGGFFAADADKLADTSTELVPDESEKYKWKSERDAVKQVKGIYGVVSQRYKPLVLRLLAFANNAKSPEAKRRRVKPRVYVCGYDWRVDVAKSAARLAAVIDDALRETGAPRVVIVAHCLGTMVARYYCRVLAGESKVHRLFLLGGMVHGVPEAYTQLKAGLSGLYVDELMDAASGDQPMTGADATARVATSGAPVAAATTTLVDLVARNAVSFTGVMGGLLALVGELYLPLCLGTMRLLTRAELRTLVRRMVPPYQMLPSPIYCSKHKNWLMFDPLATGYAPAGFTVRLPFLLEAQTEAIASFAEALDGGSRRAGDEVRRAVEDFVGRDGDTPRAAGAGTITASLTVSVSQRATVNAPTVRQLFERGQAEASQGRPDAMLDATRELLERLEQTFLDCRNPTRLYRDIYTGLLDRVEDRALCAANLAIADRTHRALTQDYREEEALTAKGLIQPFFTAVMTGVKQVADLIFNDDDKVRDEWRDRDDEDEAERQRAERFHPRAYMHPRAINIYSDHAPTISGCYLVATEVVSKHDHNLVHSEMSQDLIATALQLVAAGGAPGMASDLGALGDGHVPATTANPDADTMTSPFIVSERFPHVGHGDLCLDSNVLDYLESKIDESIEEYCAILV